jgi:hypothetical protein
MNRAIYIDGGLGRVIAALPALRASKSLVIVAGWEELFANTDIEHASAGATNLVTALHEVDIYSPEPYHTSKFRCGEQNLVESFNSLLGTEGEDYGLFANQFICNDWMGKFEEIEEAKGRRVALIQVRASGDTNARDLTEEMSLNAVEACFAAGLYPVVVGSPPLFDMPCPYFETSMSDFIALMSISTLFIGGDSSGMHLAKAMDTPGIICLTSTAGHRMYPEHFKEFRNPKHPCTFEYPRMFNAEERQGFLNVAKGVQDYSISVAEFSEAVEDILQGEGNYEKHS